MSSLPSVPSLLFLLLLVLPLDITMTVLSSSPRLVVEATRPITSNSKSYVTFKPLSNAEQGVFRGGEFSNCLPKGFYRSSTPSQFGHYQVLGSTVCASSNGDSVKP
ncbi:hypothetical protein GIB67_000238 [Kingdonia uniflora]|uniref:Uncharacterized protein n=1 Tax=Kingdonia uniflora TaxID=39325 RepID=A0A7J7LCD0_9MAGN|nr:hypothetical protein GIB67_000238 [Kingdonia uniflora]